MKTNIGVLTFPIGRAGNTCLSDLVDILHSLSNDIYLITGNDGYRFFKDDGRVHTYGIEHEAGANTFTRILRYIYTQFRISYKLAKMRNVDIWIFFIGADTLLFPMLTAKLFRKPVILALAGHPTQTLISANDNLFKPVEISSNINCALSNGIILYSPNLIKKWNLEKHKNKISIAYEYFIDINKFRSEKPLEKRHNLIGYIGRWSREKGVLNFIRAIPNLLKYRKDIEFLIAGNGELRGEIKEYLNSENLNGKVRLIGWISHDELPKYLSDIKLFVLPSYTEGLPATMLEAMACNTPVLVTPVGAIPDIIKDSENGFIMGDNSPECIARNIIRVLEDPRVKEITRNARKLIEEKYTYDAIVEKYRLALKELIR